MSNMYPPPPREIELTAHKSKGSPRESQSRTGIGYRAGKSDTPPWASSPPTCDFRFDPNMREAISTIRACVAGGGWRGRFRWGLSKTRIAFLLQRQFQRRRRGETRFCQYLTFAREYFTAGGDISRDRWLLKPEVIYGPTLHSYLYCLQWVAPIAKPLNPSLVFSTKSYVCPGSDNPRPRQLSVRSGSIPAGRDDLCKNFAKSLCLPNAWRRTSIGQTPSLGGQSCRAERA